MTFDPKKPVRTRYGCEARILCTDTKRTNGASILALITNEHGKEYPEFYYNDGKYHGGEESKYDLVNIPERVERWANVRRPHSANCEIYSYDSWETAKLASTIGGSCSSIIKLVYEGDKLVEVTLEKE